jgi:hypothetical protein
VRETVYELSGLPGPIIDLDVGENGSWVAVTGQKTAERPIDAPPSTWRFNRAWDGRLVFSSGVVLPVPQPLESPKVRVLGKDRAVIVDGPIWVIDAHQGVQATGSSGGGIWHAATTASQVVLAGSDQALGEAGFRVYDEHCQLSFTYAGQFGYGDGPEEVFACDCLAVDEAGRLLLHPYSHSVIRVDLARRTREIFVTPKQVHCSDAISPKGETVFFWNPRGSAPRRHDSRIYEWLIGSEEAVLLGEHGGPLRGLPGGRFLHVRPNGYAIVDMD